MEPRESKQVKPRESKRLEPRESKQLEPRESKQLEPRESTDSSVGAKPKSSGSSASAAADDADATGGFGNTDRGSLVAAALERIARARAEHIYDAPFANLAQSLLRQRHRGLNAEICSLDWLSGDGETDFEDKAMRMKVWTLLKTFFEGGLCLQFVVVSQLLRAVSPSLSRAVLRAVAAPPG